MAEAARQIVVDRQVRIEDLQFAESFNGVKGIKHPGFCRGQGLRLEPRFFGPYTDEVRIILDQTLNVHAVPRQNTRYVLRWNCVACRQLACQ